MTDFAQTGLDVRPSRGETAAVTAAEEISGRSTNTDWAVIIAGAMIAAQFPSSWGLRFGDRPVDTSPMAARPWSCI